MPQTAKDDFRRESSKVYALFIDFRDAFGSLKQSHMIKRLVECGIEETYCRIIADIYQDSHFEVICDQGISKEFNLNIGCKTGDPARPIFFIIDLDRSLRGLVELAHIQLKVPIGRPISPIPIGGYADDILLISLLEKVFLSVVKQFKDNIESSKLTVRPDKCNIFYERRSANRWYKAKSDKLPKVEFNGEIVKVLKRHEEFVYLGKPLTVDCHK